MPCPRLRAVRFVHSWLRGYGVHCPCDYFRVSDGIVLVPLTARNMVTSRLYSDVLTCCYVLIASFLYNL